MSFGFRVIADNWRLENKEEVRELVEVDLFEVSVVAFPAYKQTSVSVRAAKPSAARELVRELEKACGPLTAVHHREQPDKMEFSDRMREEAPPAPLKEPGVAEVRRDFRSGKQIVVFINGKQETRALLTAGSATGTRSRYRQILEAAEAKARASERKAQLAQAEDRILQRRQAARPLTRGERWEIILLAEERAGLPHTPEVEALSDSEVELFQNPYINKPDDYSERERVRNRQKDLAMKAEVVALNRRWAALPRAYSTYIAKEVSTEY